MHVEIQEVTFETNTPSFIQSKIISEKCAVVGVSAYLQFHTMSVTPVSCRALHIWRSLCFLKRLDAKLKWQHRDFRRRVVYDLDEPVRSHNLLLFSRTEQGGKTNLMSQDLLLYLRINA